MLTDHCETIFTVFEDIIETMTIKQKQNEIFLYFQEHKWKMYLEVDEDDDGNEVDALTCIRDVTFTFKPQGQIFKVTQPPYVMEKWAVGVVADMEIECVVTFEVR